jgi:hypothetical protein
MILVAFICFFLLVAAWLKAPSKAPATVEQETSILVPVPATA